MHDRGRYKKKYILLYCHSQLKTRLSRKNISITLKKNTAALKYAHGVAVNLYSGLHVTENTQAISFMVAPIIQSANI